MRIDLPTACEMLRSADNIVILTHRKPDGDTLGAGFALLFALQSMGKRARLECPDPLPKKYQYLYKGYNQEKFDAEFVVAVDIAGMQLLAGLADYYQGKIDLCIDHHGSNELYAKHSLVDSDSPAAAQIMHHVIKGLGVTPDKTIANAIYTGIITDTGAFRYADVTPETHRIAADLIEYGADFSEINRLVFETRSRGRIAVNRLLYDSLEYYFDGLCACAALPDDIKERFLVEEDDLEGISSLPRTVEGVMAGITLFDNGDGSFRASLRTFSPVDASAVCAVFGGGGHKNAAGCTVLGGLEDVRGRVLASVKSELERNGLWKESC